jgi:PAS domain S-box-containing protein
VIAVQLYLAVVAAPALLLAAGATERAQAEAARLAGERRHGITLKSIGDAVIVTDTQGRAQLFNPVAETLTGWTNEEACGRPIEEVFRIVNEKTRQPVENPARQVMRRGVVVGLANHTMLIARGGAERPIADSGAPIRNEQNQIVGVVLVFRDQTAERAAEKALSDSERRYRGLFNQANEGLLMMRLDGLLSEVNRAFAEMHGYSTDELKGMNIGDLDVLKENTLKDHADIVRRMQAGETVRFDVEHYHKDGHTFPLSVTASVVHIGGQPYSLSFHQDIAERKRAEDALRRQAAELKESNDELTRFNRAATGRELRMIELKREINELCLQSGQPARYALEFADIPAPDPPAAATESNEFRTGQA